MVKIYKEIVLATFIKLFVYVKGPMKIYFIEIIIHNP